MPWVLSVARLGEVRQELVKLSLDNVLRGKVGVDELHTVHLASCAGEGEGRRGEGGGKMGQKMEHKIWGREDERNPAHTGGSVGVVAVIRAKPEGKGREDGVHGGRLEWRGVEAG